MISLTMRSKIQIVLACIRHIIDMSTNAPSGLAAMAATAAAVVAVAAVAVVVTTVAAAGTATAVALAVSETKRKWWLAS